MDIKGILKDLEKQKDKLSYLKKLLEKIKDKKLKEQIEKLIEALQKEESLEEKISDTIPIQQSSIMQSLQEGAFELKEYKPQIRQEQPRIFAPPTREELEESNIYKTQSSSSYHASESRNPIKARITESYESNHIESMISAEARQEAMSHAKGMSRHQVVESLREMEDKKPEYTTGVSQLEEDTGFNPFKKKKKNEDYK